jgi:hypothetical protein
MSSVDLGVLQEIAWRFAIDSIAMITLLFGLYYRRYKDKELATTAAMFNIFAFCVLSVLSMVEFTVAAGFGLFAILALFSLRSEPITKIEITYFFGSVAIAVICSIKGTSPTFTTSIAAILILSAYLLDHPRILRSVDGAKITLDKIDDYIFSDNTKMREELGRKLNVEVMSYQIISVDYVNDMARVSVFFRRPR